MAILYVASEAIELKPFAALLTGVRKLKWPIDYAFEGLWEGRRILLAANGAGPRLASRAVEVAIRAVTGAELSSSRLEAVISTGYCGAVDPNLRECQLVVPSQVVDLESHDTFECSAIETGAQFVSGTLVSRDRVASYAAEKQQLQDHSAVAVDMEASGVAARARRAGLPFSCIKVVFDRADESLPLDINTVRTPDGRIARVKIGVHALSHPGVIPSLLHWKRRSEDAAKALGEFLVSCRIKSKSDPEHGSSAGE